MCWAHNIRTSGRHSCGRSASCSNWTMITGYTATRTSAICWRTIRRSARTDRDQTLSCLAAYHFDELCSILLPLTDEDWEELKQGKMLTIQAIYAQLQSTLREYHQNGGTLEGVKKFLIMPTEEKRQTIHQQTDTDQQYLLFAFFMMPPAVSVACIAKEFGAAFWKLWDEIGEQIPEAPRLYTPEPCPPVEPFPTRRFLDVKSR